jgi:hypothetical protein
LFSFDKYILFITHLSMNARFTEIQNLSDIPKNKYLVYALSIEGKYIVAGRNQYDRAKVIFDTIDNISYGDIKPLKVWKLISSKLKLPSVIK